MRGGGGGRLYPRGGRKAAGPYPGKDPALSRFPHGHAASDDSGSGSGQGDQHRDGERI